MPTTDSAPTTTPDDGIARPIYLAHVVLRSGHFQETIAWWNTVLGGHTVHENPLIAFLTYDNEHHRIALINMGEASPPPSGHSGLEHVAFTYASLADLVGTYERLRDVGIEPYWCINHGMTLSMYYRDPDRHQVELQIDLCDAKAADEFMMSSAFATNPIGIEFDPAELLHQFRAGETPTALSIYGPASPAS